jgi:iron complex transport system substrate-binding protein
MPATATPPRDGPSSPPVRVVTLLPAATEIVAALGGGALLAGVSHECDFPPEVRRLPRLTSTPIDPGAAGVAIDQAIRALVAEGRPAIRVDAEALRAAAPDLVITQGLCEVCAVAEGEIFSLATALTPGPRVLSLGARDLSGIFGDIRAVGTAIGRETQAGDLVARLEQELASLAPRERGPARRVVCVEWLDPLYLAGHWVPELVRAAGGIDVGAEPGSHSGRRSWNEVRLLDPEVIVVMLCGMGVDRATRELDECRDPEALEVLTGRPVWILDGNAYTSRPGPRVVEGAARIRDALAGRAAPGLRPWLRGGPSRP